MRIPSPVSAWRCGVRACVAVLLPLSFLFCYGSASAQLRPLSENELSSVSAQGLFTVSNTSLNGYDFTRISLEADLTLNANLYDLKLGQYAYAPRNGSGADINIQALQFGRSDASAAQRLVQITNPYFEFVFQQVNGKQEAVGMRLGFDGIAGEIGTKLVSLSGSVLMNGGAAGVIDSNNDIGGGKRWDGSCPACTLEFSQVGLLKAGDAQGASRDFWISILKTPVQFPNAEGMPALTPAQVGIWINWRDRLQALNLQELNLNSLMPPNVGGH